MSKPPVKMCLTYLIDDGSILIEGVDYEPTGPGGLDSNVRARLSPEAFESLLGVVVLAVLDQTKIVDGALHNDKEIVAGLLKLAGSKSWKSFASNAKCLEVTQKDGLIEIVPSKYESDHGGGFSYMPKQIGTCEPIPDQIHDLLLAKFKECN